jgi:hypothetical protein
MVERGMSQQRVDAIERALQSEAPKPIDYSKPRDLIAHPLPADDVKPGLLDDRGDDDDGDSSDGESSDGGAGVPIRR